MLPSGRPRRIWSRPLRAAALLAALAVTATACGGSSGGSSTSTSKGKITVGSSDQVESQIIASAYAQALKKAGYDVKEKSRIGTREVYVKTLETGEIDVIPEYAATLAEYFNAKFNGPDAPTNHPVASGDVAKTYQNLDGLAGRDKLVVTSASKAADQNAFAVTKSFADQHSLATMSDLAKLNGQLVLGAGADCPKRQFCLVGLQSVYGLKFKDFKAFSTGGDSEPLYGALKDGTIQVGLVYSSSGLVAKENVVVLQDDKHLQAADNILALLRQSVPAEAQNIINNVNQALTTEKLRELNGKADTEDPSDLAKQFLQDAHLI